MSETLCTLRTKGGGGGRYTETSLWTNSAPTSNFAAQAVTLSDSIDNYKYVKIRYRLSTSNTTEFSDIVTVSDLKRSLSGDNQMLVGLDGRTTATWARYITYTNSTSLSVTTAYQLSGTSSSQSALIPLEILGLNELATGRKLDRTLLWTNNSPTSSMSTTSVTLSDDMTKYDYLAIKFRNSTTDATEYETVMKTTDVISCAMYFGTVSTGYYVRRVNQLTDYYTIRFTVGMQPGSTATSNTSCIPTAIYGCKLS